MNSTYCVCVCACVRACVRARTHTFLVSLAAAMNGPFPVLLAGIYAAAGLAGLVGYKTGIALLLSWALFAGARTAGAPPARE